MPHHDRSIVGSAKQRLRVGIEGECVDIISVSCEGMLHGVYPGHGNRCEPYLFWPQYFKNVRHALQLVADSSALLRVGLPRGLLALSGILLALCEQKPPS